MTLLSMSTGTAEMQQCCTLSADLEESFILRQWLGGICCSQNFRVERRRTSHSVR